MAGAAEPPNFANRKRRAQGASAQGKRFRNSPATNEAVGLDQALQQLSKQMGQLIKGIQGLQETSNQLSGNIQRLQQSYDLAEDLFFCRTMNAKRGPDSQLWWPMFRGGGRPANPPATQTAVLNAQAADVDLLLQQYGRFAQVQGQPLMKRKQELLTHIGRAV